MPTVAGPKLPSGLITLMHSKSVPLLVAALLACFGAAALASEAERVVGRWLTKGDDATIEIYRDGQSFHGRIVSINEPLYPQGHSSGRAGQPKMDRNNPDPDKRSQTIVGLTLLRGFEYAGENRWANGKIYNPRDGENYSCELTLNDNGTLDVRGYLLIPLLGSSQTWRPAAK